MALPRPGCLRGAARGARELRGGAWREALSGWAPLLASLGSLARQMQALRRAARPGVPPGPVLRGFPDLPRRLSQRLRGAAEALLAQLRGEKLAELRRVCDASGALAAEAWLLCGGLGPEASSLPRTPPGPSPADLLEALLDAEASFHRTYLEAELLLLRVSLESPEEMQALPEAWEQVLRGALRSPVEDALLEAALFLEDAA